MSVRMKASAQGWLDLMPLVANRGWRARKQDDGTIRDRSGRCPICALAHELSKGQIDHYVRAHIAVRELGLDETRGFKDIVAAADWKSAPLRRDLMAALGLPYDRSRA